MKRLFVVLLPVVLSWSSLSAAEFSNLDFEAATIPQNHNPEFGFIPWSSAAPSWNHVQVSDTGSVYYRNTHFGITPWYLLRDFQSPSSNPGALAGNYSMQFRSGYENSHETNPDFVEAFLGQSGVVPLGTRSFRFLAEGGFRVEINGQSLDTISLGGKSYGGDVTSWAGQEIDFKIFHAVGPGTPGTLHLDNIEFSMQAVPEPTSIALMLLAGGFLAWRRYDP